MSQDSVCFYCPALRAGGVQYLFARLAGYLAEHSTLDVSVVDHENSPVRSYAERYHYRWISHEENHPFMLKETTTLVLPLSYLPRLGNAIQSTEGTKIFLWDIHPYNLIEQTALSGLYKILPVEIARILLATIEHTRKQKIAHLVDIGLSHYGIAFMCEANYSYNQILFGLSREPVYLPIAIEKPGENECTSQMKVHANDSLAIAWLSRLDTDKLQPILQLLTDADYYQQVHQSPQLTFHIIGDGNVVQNIQKHARACGIKALFPGRLDGSALTEYLVGIDLGFAIGTSALEFAVRGIPTVLTRGSTLRLMRQPDSPNYLWLFDSKGFNVSAEEKPDLPKLLSFTEILNSFRDYESLLALGRRCQSYAVQHHEVSRVASRLTELLTKCSFSYATVQQSDVVRYTPYEKGLFLLKRMYKQPIYSKIRKKR